jgi:hypothetical protein
MLLPFHLLVSACVAIVPGLIAGKAPSMNALALTIEHVSRQGRIVLKVNNSTGDAVRLWRDSNSWGAARWRVLRIRQESVDLFYQDPDQDFTVNVPASSELAGGAANKEELDLNGEHWCAYGHCTLVGERRSPPGEVRFEPDDRVIVIYDVPFTPEALRLGVWYGVVAAGLKVQ